MSKFHTTEQRAWARQVLAQAAYTCARCGHRGQPGARDVQADHIKPLCEGGTWDLANGQALCLDCHRPKSAQETAAATRRYLARARLPVEAHPGRRRPRGGEETPSRQRRPPGA